MGISEVRAFRIGGPTPNSIFSMLPMFWISMIASGSWRKQIPETFYAIHRIWKEIGGRFANRVIARPHINIYLIARYLRAAKNKNWFIFKWRSNDVTRCAGSRIIVMNLLRHPKITISRNFRCVFLFCLVSSVSQNDEHIELAHLVSNDCLIIHRHSFYFGISHRRCATRMLPDDDDDDGRFSVYSATRQPLRFLWNSNSILAGSCWHSVNVTSNPNKI